MQKGSKPPASRVMAMYTDWIRKGESYGAIGWYRIINPMEKLGAKIVGKYQLGGKTYEDSVRNALQLKEWGDIWWMRPSDASNINILVDTAVQFTGAKLVMDMDDDFLHINQDHPMREELERKRGPVIEQLKMADRVIVTTEPLKLAFKHLNDRITVIPNSIDPKIWDVKRKKRDDGKIRIGWTASASHYADIPLIEPPIKEVMDKYPNVEFHMMGMIPENLQNDRVFHHEATNGYREFPQHLADFDFDIAVAPLFDNQFNRCKSNIKWLEFSMLEIPIVASDVYPYSVSIEHGKTGYIAKTKDQWVRHLSNLIENAELRKTIGQNAKKEVLKNWTIDKFLPKYVEIIEELEAKRDITVVTAITGGKDALAKTVKSNRAEYICFTDSEHHSEDWKFQKACTKFVSPVMNAKIHKVLTHKYVDTDYIIWIDGNMELEVPPEKLVEQLGKHDIATFIHPSRDDIYDEADACVKLGKGNVLEICEQQKYYASQNYKRHSGLREMGLIVRKNTPKVNLMFEKWWADICRFSERDQLSFPMNFDIAKVGKLKGLTYENEFTKMIRHKK